MRGKERKVMTKKNRNAVRTFLIKDNQVVCIKYKIGNIGYFDIPGGKIEMGETPQKTAIREFKEETGIEINNLEKLGKYYCRISRYDIQHGNI